MYNANYCVYVRVLVWDTAANLLFAYAQVPYVFSVTRPRTSAGSQGFPTTPPGGVEVRNATILILAFALCPSLAFYKDMHICRQQLQKTPRSCTS